MSRQSCLPERTNCQNLLRIGKAAFRHANNNARLYTFKRKAWRQHESKRTMESICLHGQSNRLFRVPERGTEGKGQHGRRGKQRA